MSGPSILGLRKSETESLCSFDDRRWIAIMTGNKTKTYETAEEIFCFDSIVETMVEFMVKAEVGGSLGYIVRGAKVTGGGHKSGGLCGADKYCLLVKTGWIKPIKGQTACKAMSPHSEKTNFSPYSSRPNHTNSAVYSSCLSCQDYFWHLQIFRCVWTELGGGVISLFYPLGNQDLVTKTENCSRWHQN